MGKTQIPYYEKGEAPALLIHSGTHGDEYGVIESVRLAVEKYEDRLPDFVYVPIVSPSAVDKRTRENDQKLDLNRNFLEDSTVGEVEANFQIVRDKRFDLLVTFHEDNSRDSKFYLYDYGEALGGTDQWKEFKKELKELNVELLTGVDDPGDPSLNQTFFDGYYFGEVSAEGGMFDSWAVRQGIIKRALVPEIPGHLSQKTKNEAVDLFFRYFLLKA